MDEVEILEAYVPSRVRYLANLYAWLREELYSRPGLLRGFSIYEVNGGWRSTKKPVVEERTTVIRIVLDAPAAADDADESAYEARVGEIAEQLWEVTENREEQLWVIRMPARRIVVTPDGNNGS